MSKKAVTVLGDIPVEDLGVVLPHEHLLWDQLCWAHPEPQELAEREQFRQPVSLHNRGNVVYHAFDYRDNLRQTDVDVAVREARKFRLNGGGTICDVSTAGLGRDPKALRQVALETGLNVIMGTALYVASSWTDQEKKMQPKEISQRLEADFVEGIGPLRVKAGILGEVGISDVENPLEVKSLQGSGMTQNRLGCPVLIHTPIWEKKGNRILDILQESGCDLSKVALSHLDPTMDDYDYADSLAKRGAYIVYDQFGMHLMTTEGIFLPSDNERIRTVIEQVRRGNLERILISQDVCFKLCLTEWGGHGYAHILENIVPQLLRAGLSQEQIDVILIENPKRFLGW
ncbi:phosphotriesterase-related protein [Candidatus Bipolaricaulota bacterium]|nr:phosphotriesterase-related protein [Candidatus Bipolaricaulota bacterium]